MARTFHDGERAVQREAGVEALAGRVACRTLDYMPSVAQDFAMAQRLAVVGFQDAEARLWASAIDGEPGFIRPLSATELLITVVPEAVDELLPTPGAPSWPIGLVLVDFVRRRRMRVNGEARWQSDGIHVTTKEVYSNCGRHIRPRMWAGPVSDDRGEKYGGSWTTYLTLERQALIAQADTCFVATGHPDQGMDVSHKGGNPGFVVVENLVTLGIPDYDGNHLFNSLGNLRVDPRVGLLFWDFQTGLRLQVSGIGEIVRPVTPDPDYPQAGCMVYIHITHTHLALHRASGHWDALGDN